MVSELFHQTLPDMVLAGERLYPVHTDFRNWMEIEEVMFHEEGNFLYKIPRLLSLCYRRLPTEFEDAVAGLVSFYRGIETCGTTGESETKQKKRPFYSFQQDAPLFYAAFYQQYGIDLSHVKLHWWQFKALFKGLSADTQLMQVIQYRAVDLTQIENPERKKFYRKMKALYRLHGDQSKQEQGQEVAEVLSGLF